MQTIKGQSTPPILFKEKWVIVMGKEKFFLNGKQLLVLKKAMIGGNRGAVWFEKFAISIPHIQCVYLVEKIPTNTLPVGEEMEMTPEERKRSLVRLDEVREELTDNLVIDKREK